MNIKELLRFAYEKLQNIYNHEIVAEILLAQLLKKDRAFLFAHDDFLPSLSIQNKFKKFIKRLANGEPLAYILKSCEFCGYEFFVNDGVLIPRVETEQIVEIGYNFFRKKLKGRKRIFVTDVCCGCGNIGISLLLKIFDQKENFCEQFFVDFIDISSKAIKIAEQNFLSNKLNMFKNLKARFIVNNLFDGMNNRYDIVLSNPPYIADKDYLILEKSVKNFEPEIALKGGREGITIIENLIKWFVSKNNKGFLCFEMGSNQKEIIKALFDKERLKKNYKKNFLKLTFAKDLFKRDRFVLAEFLK